jgi:hypothetical protein
MGWFLGANVGISLGFHRRTAVTERECVSRCSLGQRLGQPRRPTAPVGWPTRRVSGRCPAAERVSRAEAQSS